MNIYEKLQKCRTDLQNTALKKSGNNKFAGYNYFELADFLPKVNELFREVGLCGIVRYDKEMATLDIVNSEKPEEKIQFTSPMSSAALKGCHEVQNLGAVETYERRYLYVTALEITESDVLEPTTGKPEDKEKEARRQSNREKIKNLPNKPTTQTPGPVPEGHDPFTDPDHEMREDIRRMILDMTLGDTKEAGLFLKKHTAREENGVTIPGTTSTRNLFGDILVSTYEKVLVIYTEWKEKQ
jgi:hypothetical protein